MDQKIIDLAVQKKYSDFAIAVKSELHTKMKNHEEIKSYSSEYDRIQGLKSTFAQITQG